MEEAKKDPEYLCSIFISPYRRVYAPIYRRAAAAGPTRPPPPRGTPSPARAPVSGSSQPPRGPGAHIPIHPCLSVRPSLSVCLSGRSGWGLQARLSPRGWDPPVAPFWTMATPQRFGRRR
uniref:Uncharacterized protein n=1 Tax=Catharus ustulatus TaxID=91951 RepID=A0A8C3UTI1_CATUS